MHALVSCKNVKVQLKMKALGWLQHFPIISLWIFFRCSRAANSTVLGPIWPNFELIRDVINVLVTCKNEEDSIKNEGARVFTTLYIIFFRRSRADNSEVCDGIWPKFKLIQAFMQVLVTCTMNQIKEL